jgi:hypothetical protein
MRKSISLILASMSLVWLATITETMVSISAEYPINRPPAYYNCVYPYSVYTYSGNYCLYPYSVNPYPYPSPYPYPYPYPNPYPIPYVTR